jgi:hypothetical protein
MNATYKNQDQLWSMAPHDFNEWRAKNDLPLLFEYLRGVLPKFGEWLESLPFDMDVTLRIVPTGDLFKGEKNKVVLKRPGDVPDTTVIECREDDIDAAESWWRQRGREIEILGEIEPYFKWAKRTLGRERFFIWDKANRQVSDEIRFASWSGINAEGVVTRAHLFRDFVVLKLGQITLPRSIVIGSRNLDFCDLDFLNVTDGFHGSYWATINYSSAREITFSGAEVAFFTFHKCSMTSFTAKGSRLQDFYFEETNLQELRLNDSFVYRMGFKESNMTPFIQNCELRELKFSPKKNNSPVQVATTYRLLRAAYQSSGLRQEASDCYYRERVFERKSYFHPYYANSKAFQGIPNGGRFSAVLEFYNRGFYEFKDLPRELYKAAVSKLKMHTLPKYLIPLMKSRLRWFASGFESLLWGYGERPSRIVLVAIGLIGCYAGAYQLVEWVDDKGYPLKMDFWDSVYFSVVTFTTLGYGDITPKTLLLKSLAGSEALLGAFSMGLIVAGFSNRSRY